MKKAQFWRIFLEQNYEQYKQTRLMQEVFCPQNPTMRFMNKTKSGGHDLLYYRRTLCLSLQSRPEKAGVKVILSVGSYGYGCQ